MECEMKTYTDEQIAEVVDAINSYIDAQNAFQIRSAQNKCHKAIAILSAPQNEAEIRDGVLEEAYSKADYIRCLGSDEYSGRAVANIICDEIRALKTEGRE